MRKFWWIILIVLAIMALSVGVFLCRDDESELRKITVADATLTSRTYMN